MGDMRLIDANALVGKDVGIAWVSTEAIKNAPTIDAVPVVRCKCCRWRDTVGCPYNVFGRRVERPDNGYCDDGEPKDGE